LVEAGARMVPLRQPALGGTQTMKRWIVAVAGVAALAWIGMTVAPAAPQA